MGAVEDADHARRRAPRAIAPQEVVAALLGGGRLEGGDPDTLRVDEADGVPQHAALAGGVHALQDEQHARMPVGLALGVEPLLQLGERLAHRGQRRLAVHLVARRSRGSARVDGGQVDRPLREAEEGPYGLSGGTGVCFFLPIAAVWPNPGRLGRSRSTSSAPSSSRTTANAMPGG